MTIRHLEIFTAVVNEGSMSAAAKKLHISQPSVSLAVSELEKYYGIKVFERLSQKLYITKEGELMLSYSRHILDSFNKMESAINEAAAKPTLKIGCSVSVGTCLINDILDKAGEKLITLNMLNGVNYVSREGGSADRNQFEKLFEEYDISLNRVFCSTNTEAIKNAVIHGRGIAIFSKLMVEKECENGDLIILPIKDTVVKRNFNFVIHKNKYISKHINTLKNLFYLNLPENLSDSSINE